MSRTVRNRYVFLCDAVAFTLAPTLAYAIRFEGTSWSRDDTRTLIAYTAVTLSLKLALLLRNGLYNRLWARAGIQDLVSVLRAAAVMSLLCVVLGAAVLPLSGLAPQRVPLSVLILDAFATLWSVSASRMLFRVLASRPRARPGSPAPATLIVGAGAAGDIIARELLSNPQLGLRLVGFADDDPNKYHRLLCGVPVLGGLADIPELVEAHHISEMIIAMPTAPGPVVRKLVRMAHEAGVHTRTVPGLSEIISERVSVSALRDVQIQDLLRREPVLTDLAATREVISGRNVLITGAGGSIGSELCRQVARLQPARLILLGHGENSIFDIQTAIAETHPELDTLALIADVRDRLQINRLLLHHRPDVIFHAAAHKHVPLMEGNVTEAILNNVVGTASLVDAALAAGTERFVLISSDKAVRPCSIMGATKRVAEMVVQQAGIAHGRPYVAVRFGNVLGSRGSVVPTFLRQIRAGGPVVVTHPEMRRYFMTIPEAVQLVLQAGTLGHRGEVFVLDMGEPVRIIDLAEDLIRLSGLQPHDDIEIRFSGMRPGERLAEELSYTGEQLTPTGHPKVLRATNGGLVDWAGEGIRQLLAAATDHRPEPTLWGLLSDLVPEGTFATGMMPHAAAIPNGASPHGAEGVPDLRESDAGSQRPSAPPATPRFAGTG